MTVNEALAEVRQHDAHLWAYRVADDGTVVVGGTDHRLSEAYAREAGYHGPILRAYTRGCGPGNL